MYTYTFLTRKTGFIKIQADTEFHARMLCMTKTYGPSTYGHEYKGLGLTLIQRD